MREENTPNKLLEMDASLVVLHNPKSQLEDLTTQRLLLHTTQSSLSIMKNQLLISTPTLKRLKLTFILLNQLQIPTTSIITNQLKNISHTSLLQFLGATTMLNHLPLFTGTKNQLNHTTK
jgi:hypothetical protein